SGIFDRRLIAERVRVDGRQAFDQMHISAGDRQTPLVTKRRMFGEVRRVDDERVALPAASRITGPEAYAGTGTGSSVQLDDPCDMHHLAVDDDGAGGLHDLVVAVVARLKGPT